jgi:hypothetical protein
METSKSDYFFKKDFIHEKTVTNGLLDGRKGYYNI